MSKVIVIGAGPSGLMAAYIASRNGHSVSLFEKNAQMGKKLQLTGHGRCNVTNNCSKDEFFGHVVHNEKFLYSAFSQFSNIDMIQFLKKHGMPTIEEERGRMFPSSNSAKEVALLFANLLRENNVELHMEENCKKLIIKDNVIQGVQTNKQEYACDVVIVATGGKSFSVTGSSGDGYIWAKENNIKVSDVYPGLVSLKTKEQFDLAGLSFQNVNIQIQKDKKVLYKNSGDILFTHDGLSGPGILVMSSYVINKNPTHIYIDFMPNQSIDEVDQALLNQMKKYPNKLLKSVLENRYPNRFVEYMFSVLHINENIKVHDTTKQQRRSMSELLKKCSFEIESFGDFDQAMITVGGIKTNQINPKTMESKSIQGLKFVGEVLDLDAQTGGFNLQIAWTTGYVAASTI
jgi:predicted Rossmann fold flavoprotein